MSGESLSLYLPPACSSAISNRSANKEIWKGCDNHTIDNLNVNWVILLLYGWYSSHILRQAWPKDDRGMEREREREREREVKEGRSSRPWRPIKTEQAGGKKGHCGQERKEGSEKGRKRGTEFFSESFSSSLNLLENRHFLAVDLRGATAVGCLRCQGVCPLMLEASDGLNVTSWILPRTRRTLTPA